MTRKNVKLFKDTPFVMDNCKVEEDDFIFENAAEADLKSDTFLHDRVMKLFPEYIINRIDTIINPLFNYSKGVVVRGSIENLIVPADCDARLLIATMSSIRGNGIAIFKITVVETSGGMSTVYTYHG